MRRGKPNTDPLRKVIGDAPVAADLTTMHGEQLECLHVIVPREDFMGPTVAKHRRCWRCGKAGVLRTLVGVALLSNPNPRSTP